MALSKEVEERFQKLESSIKKHKYYITLLCGAYLRRDISTGTIEYIDDDDTPQNIDQFLLVDMFCIEDWDTEIMNNPEKCWVLEHMHPGKTARQAWRKEVKEYNEYMANTKHIEPEPYKGPAIDMTTKSNDVKPVIYKPKPEPKHTAEWQHDHCPNW